MNSHNSAVTEKVIQPLRNDVETVFRTREPRLDRRLSSTIMIVTIVALLALGVRVAWLVQRTTVIEGEGANYARMAENIATGKGWLGMQGHLQLFYPPLYPLLMVGVYSLVHNVELAGRLVSIAFGTLLIVPVFLIATELYGQRVACIAAFIVALHPIFVGLSAEVYSESTYMFLLFMAMFCGMRAARQQSRRMAIAAGLFLGLAYLTRTEALVATVFLAALIVLVGWENRKKASGIAACLVVACLLVGAPYVAFLKAKTGQFRIEAKSADNFTYGQMRLAGIPWEQAFRSIDDNLKPTGLSMRTELDVLSTTRVSLPTVMRFVKLAALENSRRAMNDLLEEKACGGFVLVALVAIGLFGSPWNRARTFKEIGILAFLLLLFLPLLSLVTYWNTRYILPMLLVLIIWGASGAAGLAEWGRQSIVNSFPSRSWTASTGMFVMAAATGALLWVTWSAPKHVENLRSGDPATKLAGLRLREVLPAGAIVMDTDNLVAFYSGGIYRPFPYAGEDTALRYIAANNVEILVVRQQNAETSNPYYEKWISHGIPDPLVRLIASIPSDTYGNILLYRRH